MGRSITHRINEDRRRRIGQGKTVAGVDTQHEEIDKCKKGGANMTTSSSATASKSNSLLHRVDDI